MSTAGPDEPETKARIVTDVVCTSCGCLCDDIELRIEGDRIIEARDACGLGRSRFLGYRPGTGPACLLDGHPATIDEGIERAAAILAEARHPLIFGLGDATCEADRAAVALADRIGACVDIAGGCGADATLEALQSVGESTCTLGEVRNRADLIVVWRADPLESHPRLFSRYALEPAGTFLPGGRADRYCVIVDVHETRSVREAADQFIAIRRDGEFEALWILRALAAGIAVDPSAIESGTGVPLETWQGLIDRMQAARYGVLFYGVGEAGHPVAQAVHSLTRDLNSRSRFVCLPLHAGGGNSVGAANVMAWSTGFPGAVSLARGYPLHGPGEFQANELLGERRADAALIVSGDPVSTLSLPAREHLSRIPWIVLSDEDLAPSPGVAVAFRTAAFGINTTGTVYRMDGVPMPMRPSLASPFPDAEEVLRAIEGRLRGGRCP